MEITLIGMFKWLANNNATEATGNYHAISQFREDQCKCNMVKMQRNILCRVSIESKNIRIDNPLTNSLPS